MSTQAANTSDNLDFFGPDAGSHDQAVTTDGLDHIFKWASEAVSPEAEDGRARQARETRVRRQVLDVVQHYKEQKIAAKSQDEVNYLQRRVIALLTRLQEVTEEASQAKQIMVTQYWALQQIPALEAQVKTLKAGEYEKEAAVKERRYLMDALAKIKVERDYLEDILVTVEDENTRLSSILRDTRQEVVRLQSRKWWHFFMPEKV